MTKVKKESWIKRNFMRLWVSGFAAMGTGFIIEMLVGIFYKPSIHSGIMTVIIIGAAIGYWFVLVNNKNFGKF